MNTKGLKNFMASRGIVAAADVAPVAASIVTPTYIDLMIQHHKCRLNPEQEQDAWGALIQHIDQHCAAQVARALAAVDPVAQTLMRAGHGPEEAMRLAIGGRINADLAAKPTAARACNQNCNQGRNCDCGPGRGRRLTRSPRLTQPPGCQQRRP